MLITHMFIRCTNCKCKLEVFDEEYLNTRTVICHVCDNIDSLEDKEVVIWEEEF